MEKKFNEDAIIPVEDYFVVVDKETKCPAGSWAIFPNTINGEIKDYIGCQPIQCKYDYAANGNSNLYIVATIGKRIRDIPLVELPEERAGLRYVLSLPNADHLAYWVQELIEKAYNAGASKAKYTEEDIDKLLSLFTDEAPGFYIKKHWKDHIKSLQTKRPISVTLEYWGTWGEGTEYENPSSLKVSNENTTKALEVTYETI